MKFPLWLAGVGLAFGLSACGGDDPVGVGSPGPGFPGGGVGGGAPDVEASDLDPLSFVLTFENNSRGEWRDDEVYITIAGNNAGVGGKLTYVQPAVAANVPGAVGEVNDHIRVTPDDTVAQLLPGSHTANDDPDRCVEHEGSCYPQLWFTLADLHDQSLVMPGDGKYYGTRIYVSYGQPMYMRVNPDDNGLVQLDVGNPGDVNFNTINDFFELTYDPYSNDGSGASVTFGANVTQVDGFAIPIDFTLQGDRGTIRTRGITLGADSSSGAMTRAELIRHYLDEVSAPFQSLVQRAPDGTLLRVIAPYKSRGFQEGGAYFSYYDNYMEDIWAFYRTQPLVSYDQPGQVGNRFEGQVVNNGDGEAVLRFTRYGVDGSVSGPHDMPKANTFQLFTQNGPFPNDAPQAVKDMFRDLSSAVHRHVATDTAVWHEPSAYYQGAPQHEYARFLHEVSLDGKAYAFGYDDAADQSPVIILPGGENPVRLTVRING